LVPITFALTVISCSGVNKSFSSSSSSSFKGKLVSNLNPAVLISWVLESNGSAETSWLSTALTTETETGTSDLIRGMALFLRGCDFSGIAIATY
jgi:hypothetical protein